MPQSNGVYAPNMRAVPTGEFVTPNRKTNGVGVQAEDTRICVVMVGLPARGKSLIAQKGTLGPRGVRRLLIVPPRSRSLPALALHQSEDVQRWHVPPHRYSEPVRRVL